MPSRRSFLRGFAAMLGCAALPTPVLFMELPPDPPPTPPNPCEYTITVTRADLGLNAIDMESELIRQVAEAIARDVDRQVYALLSGAAESGWDTEVFPMKEAA